MSASSAPLPRVIVVGLGPGGPDLLTVATMAAIDAAASRGAAVLLRTERHPSASLLASAARSFDALYDSSAEFAEVYAAIVDDIVATARDRGDVLYAVPGSPAVAEHTVELLREREREGLIRLVVHPALSFADLAWARLGIDPLAGGARIVDAHRFAIDAAGERGPLLVAQCSSRAVLSEVKLSWDSLAAPPRVTVLQRLGLPDEAVFDVDWADLDRNFAPDHLTSIWIPRLAAPIAGEVAQLMELMRTLRANCPWDIEQTHATLAKYCIEEAYELAEAIDALTGRATSSADDGEPSAAALDAFVGELGDVLFQVIFHAAIGEEQGQFTLADVARQVHDKLVFRHPHVFPREGFDASGVDGAASVVANWEAIKATERASAGGDGGPKRASDVPGHLPALAYAQEVVKRLEKTGHKVRTLSEVQPGGKGADLGELLLAVVVSARAQGLDAETILRQRAGRLVRELQG